MSGLSDSVADFKNTVSGVVDSGRGWVDDLSGALDFGSSAPAQSTQPTSQARELDISEIDRSNPTDVNRSTIAGLPPMVVYIGGGLLGLVVLKKFKVI